MARIEADKSNWNEFKARVRESQDDFTLTNDEVLEAAIKLLKKQADASSNAIWE